MHPQLHLPTLHDLLSESDLDGAANAHASSFGVVHTRVQPRRLSVSRSLIDTARAGSILGVALHLSRDAATDPEPKVELRSVPHQR